MVLRENAYLCPLDRFECTHCSTFGCIRALAAALHPRQSNKPLDEGLRACISWDSDVVFLYQNMERPLSVQVVNSSFSSCLGLGCT